MRKFFFTLFIIGLFSTQSVTCVIAQDYKPNEIIVKYKQNESPENLTQTIDLRSKRAANIIGFIQNTAENVSTTLTGNQTPETKLEKLKSVENSIKLKSRQQLKIQTESKSLSNIYLLKTETQDVNSLINIYKSLPNVVSVEPNIILKTQVIPNDTNFPDQWHYSKIGLPQAWDITTGTNNIVAVLDSGIDYNHIDLPASRIIKGHDYVNNDEDPMDDNGHGTFVSGIIGATTNNNLGVAGINWNVRLLVYKIVDSTGNGDTYSVIQAIVAAADYGAKVINLSVAGDAQCSTLPTLQNAINYANGKGTTIVTAAGNENVDASTITPASCNNVITVAATSIADLRASYSNYGSVIDIAAPGGDYVGTEAYIVSTIPNNEISAGQGTSFAAPHVTGVVSLILSKNPSLTPQSIETMLKNSAVAITTDFYIGKRLNTYNALLLATGQPLPTPQPSSTPSLPPNYSITDLKQLIDNYLHSEDSQYDPVDNKINMMDASWVIKWLE